MIEELFSAAFVRKVAPNEFVFHAGDLGRHMYVLRSGSIDIIAADEWEGPGALIRRVTSGEMFGEIALIEDVPRTAHARAGNEGAELLEIDHAHFVYLAV